MTNSSVESVDTKGKGCVVHVKTEKGEEKLIATLCSLLLESNQILKILDLKSLE